MRELDCSDYPKCPVYIQDNEGDYYCSVSEHTDIDFPFHEICKNINKLRNIIVDTKQ